MRYYISTMNIVIKYEKRIMTNIYSEYKPHGLN